MSDNLIAPVERPNLRERGMATVEYALGVVVVIVIIGAIVLAIQTGTFGDLVNELLKALMNWIKQAFELPFMDFFTKP